MRLLVGMIMAVYLLVMMTVMVIGGEENDGDDGPPVGGERAGLVRADRRRVAHRLARVQVPHQVVVAHHFLDRVSQGESDCKGKSLWHGYDEDGDADDDEVDVVAPAPQVPFSAISVK